MPAGNISPASPLSCGPPLSPETLDAVRRACMLEHCKWDPQAGDTSTLAPFALFMAPARWRELAGLAEALSAEVFEAEVELSRRPRLLAGLGLPAPLRQVFAGEARCRATPSIARTMRFDFHWTHDGWRVSEVNSDVPGGFAEAEGFTALMAERHPGAEAPGAPGSRWAEAMAEGSPEGARVALLSAPWHMEDHQVVAYLAQRLRAVGLRPLLAAPWQIVWRGAEADLGGALGAVVRFYQAEWLSMLPARSGWPRLFVGGETPVTNAGRAALAESKRLPLVWGELSSPCRLFARLLPETRDPREAPWLREPGWLLKPAYGNTGDHVVSPRWTSARRWAAASAKALLEPGAWVAQRAFSTVPLETPAGAMFPCIGVYTVDGKAAGAYARLSLGPVVDSSAIDAALLLRGQP